MKWHVINTSGASFPISAPTESAARELAVEYAQKHRLHREITSVKPFTKENEVRGQTYVVIDPIVKDFKGHLLNKRWQWQPVWEPHVKFEGGLPRCVEYVMRNSRDIDHIRAKSGKGRLRNLTEAEETKADKLTDKLMFPGMFADD